MFACFDAKGENYLVEVDLLGANKKDTDLSMHKDTNHVLAERIDLTFHGHYAFL